MVNWKLMVSKLSLQCHLSGCMGWHIFHMWTATCRRPYSLPTSTHSRHITSEAHTDQTTAGAAAAGSSP